MQKILKYLGPILLTLTALFLLACNHNLAGIVAAFAPTAYAWVFVALLLIEAAAFYWLWRGMFGRQDHLIFDEPNPKAQEQLKSELVNRFKENDLIKNANLDPECVEECLALLNQKADEEIQRTAKGIFMSTAMSQNGRIDAIIMFVSLCRIVWRVSFIYNQKPHPFEVLRLYQAVAISTFLAYSIEELNIVDEISASFGGLISAVVPTIAIGATPFLGTALQKVTASVFDGTANCFLALRTGIITRNAYRYILVAKKERPIRVDVFKEAGSMLMRIAGKPINNIIGVAKTIKWKKIKWKKSEHEDPTPEEANATSEINNLCTVEANNTHERQKPILNEANGVSEINIPITNLKQDETIPEEPYQMPKKNSSTTIEDLKDKPKETEEKETVSKKADETTEEKSPCAVETDRRPNWLKIWAIKSKQARQSMTTKVKDFSMTAGQAVKDGTEKVQEAVKGRLKKNRQKVEP